MNIIWICCCFIFYININWDNIYKKKYIEIKDDFNLDDINELKPTDSQKKRKLTELSAIGSLLIVISGLIFLYIAYADQDIDVEIAFN